MGQNLGWRCQRGLFKQRGPPLHQATTKDTEMHQEYAPWRKKLYGSKMMNQNAWCNKTHPKSVDWNLKACDTCIPGSQAGFCQVGAERIRNALVGPKSINMHQHAIPLKYRKCNVNSVMWMVWLIYFGRIFWCLHGGRQFGLFRKPAPCGHALARLAKCLPACMSDT